MRRFGFGVLAVLSLMGAAVAQLSWPVAGSVGQTWKVEFKGIGTWTLRLTQTNNSGTVMGQAAGPDTRVGYFQYFQQQDVTVLWLDKSETDSYGCVFDRNGVKGGVINGDAARDNGPNTQLEDLKTICTLTLQGAAQTPTPPTPPTPTPPTPTPPTPTVTLSWPLQLAVGQNYTATIQGTGAWNVALTTASGAAFTGTGTPTQGGPALQASFFNRPDVDSAELDLTDGNQLYSCLFTGRASLQNGALVGQTFYRATASGQFQSMNRSCEVRPAAGAQVGPGPTPLPNPQPQPQPPVNSSLSWPPQFAVGQTWTGKFQAGTWTATFTEKDSDGDPRGVTTSGPDQRVAGAFMLQSGSAAFYVLNKTDAYYCIAARAGLQGNTLSGQAQRMSPPNAQQGQAAGACSFSLQGGSSGGNNSTGGQGGLTVPNWPNLGKVGQTWGVNLPSVGQWTVTFTQVSDKGNPIGKASGTDARVGYFQYFKDDDMNVLWLDGDNDYYGCGVKSSGIQGNTITGKAYEGIGDGEPDETGLSCTVTLQAQTLSVVSDFIEWLRPLPALGARVSHTTL